MSHSLAAGFSFSFFFFLHFQGLKMRPRLASLLLQRTGGVRTPETRQPECSTLCWSITSRTQNNTQLKLKIGSGATRSTADTDVSHINPCSNEVRTERKFLNHF